MVDYEDVFARNRNGIHKVEKFKMTKVLKVILGYYKIDTVTRDKHGNKIRELK